MRHVKRPRHPATCVCKRSSPRGSPDVAFAVVGGDLGSVLAAAAAPGGEAVVIVKPSRGACGRGIKVFRLEAATDALEEALKGSFGDTREVVVRAGKESEIPNFKGSDLGRFPLVSADFWTSDHLSERSRSVDAFPGTRARGTLMLKRT